MRKPEIEPNKLMTVPILSGMKMAKRRGGTLIRAFIVVNWTLVKSSNEVPRGKVSLSRRSL